MGEKIKKLLDEYFPVHGNNTEARRAEASKTIAVPKASANTAPITGQADKARNVITDKQRRDQEAIDKMSR